jgi:serine O-acetyltransferase
MWLRDLYETVERISLEDPAAQSRLEIWLTYPAIHALAMHRLASWLWQVKLPLLPKLLSQIGRFLTQIEIHPGAKIGRRLFIDHGAGVVIGETAEIGDDVLLYHQVTLGGTSTEKTKRHPTLGDRVVVGAGAKILGAIQIGNDAKIGAGSVIVRDVPERATAVGVPGRIVFMEGKPLEVAPKEENTADPEAMAIKALSDRLYQLEERVRGVGISPDGPASMNGVEDFLHGAGI